MTRREFLAKLAIGIGVPAALYAGPYRYGTQIEPFDLEINEHEIDLGWARKKWPSLRILHMSDLHVSPGIPLEYIERTFQKGLDLQPDFIVFTGDYITGRVRDFTDYKMLFKGLSSTVPTFASLGNHDGGEYAKIHEHGYSDTTEIIRLLSEANIQVLHNADTSFEILGRKIRLTGIGDSRAGYFDPKHAFQKADSDFYDVHIALSHDPDTKDALLSYSWDILLCGHTHGGQIRLPLIGAPFVNIRDRRFIEGLHNWQNRWVFVNRGVGNTHGIRINCPPEIALLRIV